MRDSLLWRLLSSHILVIAIAVVISGVLITNLASRSFMTIMAHYHIEPVMVEREFHTATREILVGSSVVAAASAMFFGWVLVRKLVRPLERMTVPRAVGALSLPGRRSGGWREWTG